MPRFVIVTPAFNASQYIGDTLLSVDRQNWEDWVHVVVDGGSADDTVAIVERSMASDPRRRLVTGKDRGIYDAVFKGFEMVDAREDDVLLWINADDMLAPWALATMAPSFAAGADWVTALPGQWDDKGRLTHIVPSAWYPRLFLRWGMFHGRCLGWLQQESTFFSRRLLNRVEPAFIARLRIMKYAGDFALWREFARHVSLESLTTVVSGFRLHGANMSGAQDRYFAEAAAEGAFIPPRPVSFILRGVYRLAALLVTASRARRVARRENARVRGGARSYPVQ